MSQSKTHATEVQKQTAPARQLEQEATRQPEQGPVQQVAPPAAYRRAQVDRNGLRAADLLALQRAVGNRVVQRMVARRMDIANDEQQNTLIEENFESKVQAKFTADASQNIHEQLGYYKADVVMRMSEPKTKKNVKPSTNAVGRHSSQAVDTNQVTLYEEGTKKPRKISIASQDFTKNYIDYNIQEIVYWSTAFAKTDKKYRDFWVYYNDGRQLQFNLDDVPVRDHVKQTPGYIRVTFNPRVYYRRGGFIFPVFYNDAMTPRLIDVATTITFNHNQREKYLEIAELTFKFAIILSAYAATPKTPKGSQPPLRTSAPKTGRQIPEAAGAGRAQRFGSNWQGASLKETVKRIAGDNPIIQKTKSGKILYRNPQSGLQVVYDQPGNYFRVENPNATAVAARYLDQFGKEIPANVSVIRPRGTTQTGVPQDVRQVLTHFRNTD